MRTPIYDFVSDYIGRDPLRLHMPGHKGMPFIGCEARDITEIGGADVLYAADGIIAESEANAASLFGAGRTLYSTEGSSLVIRAMLALLKAYAAECHRPARILAARGAHRALLYGAALVDLEIDWLEGEGGSELLSPCPGADQIASTLDRAEEKPLALYLTAPDYLGNLPDLREIAALCHSRGVLLFVDNAHGAYLSFLSPSRHPLALGADLCADSAHKTLPVLTGGAYLHISQKAPSFFAERAPEALSLFASSSPSYLILQSLDLCNRYLCDGYAERLADFVAEVEALKDRLSAAGFSLVGTEPLKLTVRAKPYGYTGDALASHLTSVGIIPEFFDPDYLTLMLTPELGAAALSRLEAALASLAKRAAIESPPPRVPRAKRVLSIRKALFAPCETVSPEAARGRVLSSAAISCPPAIPICICGEEIGDEAIRCFAYYGIREIRVCKKEADGREKAPVQS
jgi:arginine/lysine/ornithine decarboxylase